MVLIPARETPARAASSSCDQPWARRCARTRFCNGCFSGMTPPCAAGVFSPNAIRSRPPDCVSRWNPRHSSDCPNADAAQGDSGELTVLYLAVTGSCKACHPLGLYLLPGMRKIGGKLGAASPFLALVPPPLDSTVNASIITYIDMILSLGTCKPTNAA